MKKALIWISVGLNVLVVAVVILAMSGSLFTIVAPLFRNYMVNPNYDRWVSQFEALSVEQGDVVFLGDSITRGGSWDELYPDRPIRNRGIGGDTTSGVLERLHQVTSGNPSQVFLLIGTNDISFGEPDETIVSNISTIVDRIEDESPGTQVYIQSILPRAADHRDRIEGLNEKIRERIIDRAEWVDLYPLFLDEDGSIADQYSNDELHLHGAGYTVWSEAIGDQVRAR
ncbi:MAG TPA: sialate O-acetylesterase [Gammaproteobacteria bacterium]|nr:sialate O-acetylesterase [Gammaproteobacteria bacterium]